MWQTVDLFLSAFRQCFSRNSAYCWFVVVVAGFLIRPDHLGVTSFIRCLFLDPVLYDPLMHSFRSSAWQLSPVLAIWAQLLIERFPLVEVNGRLVMAGDGIKVCKEATRMPAVKPLHQDSENNGKPKYFAGHHFGVVGLLVGLGRKRMCVPLEAQLHEGIDHLRPGQSFEGKPPTVVSRMAHLAVATATRLDRPCYVTLDAYHAVRPTFLIFKRAVTKSGATLVHLITRAKSNYVAYTCHGDDPDAKLSDDNKLVLDHLFDYPEFFEETSLFIYGRTKTLRICCFDLYWRPIRAMLRFVWVIDGDGRYVLMSSDLDLAPSEIVRIYSFRFKIEVTFHVMKHLVGAFYYHFWTQALPKLKGCGRRDLDRLTAKELQKFDQAVEAIERFVNLGGIALGLLQFLALTRSELVWNSYQGWMRTYSSEIPSERIVQDILKSEFVSIRGKVRNCQTLRIIAEKARECPVDVAA
jgi:hypothetical protein